MATQAYYTWVSRGRHFSRPTWLVEIKARAKAAGVPFLGDLGDEAHLKSSNPLDHTPFSNTEYPLALSDYWINAIDLGDGPWSDRLLADCRAGKNRWVKYLLFRGKSYSRRNNWTQQSGPDQHLHISGMTDHLHDSIGDYNPFVRTPAVHSPGTRTLREQSPLMQGEDVVFVQKALDMQSIPADGVYGAKTANGIRWFQGSRKLEIDGICGPATWKAFGIAVRY